MRLLRRRINKQRERGRGKAFLCIHTVSIIYVLFVAVLSAVATHQGWVHIPAREGGHSHAKTSRLNLPILPFRLAWRVSSVQWLSTNAHVLLAKNISILEVAWRSRVLLSRTRSRFFVFSLLLRRRAVASESGFTRSRAWFLAAASYYSGLNLFKLFWGKGITCFGVVRGTADSWEVLALRKRVRRRIHLVLQCRSRASRTLWGSPWSHLRIRMTIAHLASFRASTFIIETWFILTRPRLITGYPSYCSCCWVIVQMPLL